MADAKFTIEVLDAGSAGAPDATKPPAPLVGQGAAEARQQASTQPTPRNPFEVTPGQGLEQFTRALGLGPLHKAASELIRASKALAQIRRPDQPRPEQGPRPSKRPRAERPEPQPTRRPERPRRPLGPTPTTTPQRKPEPAGAARPEDSQTQTRAMEKAASALGTGGVAGSAAAATRTLIRLSTATAAQTRETVANAAVMRLRRDQILAAQVSPAGRVIEGRFVGRPRITDARPGPPAPTPARPQTGLAVASGAAGATSLTATRATATAGAGAATSGATAGAGAALAAAIGPVGVAAAAVTVTFGLAALAAKKFADAAEREAERLSGFSPELSIATARTEIRRELADLRRAQRLGPEAARFEDTRSRAEDALTDLGTEIKLILLRFVNEFTPVIVVATDILAAINEFLENFNQFEKQLNVVTRFIADSIFPLLPALRRIADHLEAMRQEREVEDEAFTGQFFDLVRQADERFNRQPGGAL